MRIPDTSILHEKFMGEVNKEWSFLENRSTEVLTHGYHRYPAKFVPHLVRKLIENYTEPGDKIADVFAGCGTTLVEGKIHGRKSIGVDINPVAQLITRAKVNPIKPSLLEKEFAILMYNVKSYSNKKHYSKFKCDKIDYWFDAESKNKIAFLYDIILQIENDKRRDFFLCALSNILKNCSKWLQSSTKPQVDPNKIPGEVFTSFTLQVKRMAVKNSEYYNQLRKDGHLSTYCDIKLADSRWTGIHSNSINAIITSPPYVTSYEYADIHQLTGYWFEYVSDISAFRKKFIGTFYSQNKELRVSTDTAQNIINRLNNKDKRLAGEIANYFNNMIDVAKEMMRILAPHGVVCLVVGNTTLRNVKVKSAEVFAEMLYMIGFDIEEVIKRKIPFKLIPTIRDKVTGRFSKLESETSRKVYPEEFIIIARKPMTVI